MIIKKGISAIELGKRKVKPVLTPPAQSNTQCAHVDALELAGRVADMHLDALMKEGIEVYALARLMYHFGLRVSEALSIEGRHIDRFGNIIVMGLKGSSSRKVADTQLVGFWKSKIALGSHKVFGFDRFYVYRTFKRVGIGITEGGSTRSIVTHLPRHLFISDTQKVTHKALATAEVVGHKSVKSTSHYLDKSKKKTPFVVKS
jgi:integrase